MSHNHDSAVPSRNTQTHRQRGEPWLRKCASFRTATLGAGRCEDASLCMPRTSGRTTTSFSQRLQECNQVLSIVVTEVETENVTAYTAAQVRSTFSSTAATRAMRQTQLGLRLTATPQTYEIYSGSPEHDA
jgi:hypothetical protein